MGSIYRFEKIQRFRQLVVEKALTFVLPELWPDKNEGYLFKAVESTDGRRKVQEAIKKVFPESDGFELALLQIFKRSRYAQCWSRCPENDALWKGYEVRIEAERDYVSKLDGIEAYDVRYVDSVNLEEELRTLFIHHKDGKLSWKPENVLLIKRTQFSHEQEVRLLTKIIKENVVDRKQDWASYAMIAVFHREYQEGKITKEEFERHVKELTISATRKVSIAHVPNFIRSVMLSPLAPSEIDRQMSHFCAQSSLNYLGKSRMYEFNL